MHSRVKVLSAVGALGLLAATGCTAAKASSGGSAMAATAAYVQQPSATGKATVGYLDIRNNGADDQLVSVTTSVGGKVELRGPAQPHASPVVMRTVRDIPLPSHAMTQLIPNSYHLLITGAGPMHDGKDITLTLNFAQGNSVTVLALVTDPQSGGSSFFLN
ncbi:MAG TPA: copper chaperone PCu(A)C [Trebonia sp.]|jgi:copper(I)-binding protein|nr:copper chaperone PCu(A)C [Trebonia sp.]